MKFIHFMFENFFTNVTYDMGHPVKIWERFKKLPWYAQMSSCLNDSIVERKKWTKHCNKWEQLKDIHLARDIFIIFQMFITKQELSTVFC